MTSRDPDFPPILATGFHTMSLTRVRELCVIPFAATSQTREEIMQGLEAIVEHLTRARVVGEIWVDGSFLTHKIDPEDVDILLHVQADFYDGASTQERDAMDWAGSNLRSSHKAHSFLWVEQHPQPDAPDYWEPAWYLAYWTRQFGVSRENEFKGIALLQLICAVTP